MRGMRVTPHLLNRRDQKVDLLAEGFQTNIIYSDDGKLFERLIKSKIVPAAVFRLFKMGAT